MKEIASNLAAFMKSVWKIDKKYDRFSNKPLELIEKAVKFESK